MQKKSRSICYWLSSALKSAKWFVTVYAPLVLVIAIILSLLICVTAYQNDDYFQHTVSCSTNPTPQAIVNMDNYIYLKIEEWQGSKFKVSGSLFLKPEAYAQLKKKYAEMTVVLDPLKSTYLFMSPPPVFLSVDNKRTIDSVKNIVEVKISDGFIYSNANVSTFPFEEYRIGIIPNLYVNTSKNKVLELYKLNGAVVTGNFSRDLIVDKATVWSEFAKDVQMSESQRATYYSAEECPLIIKRPFWYRALVILLVLLLFVPSFYLAYKAENNPGLGLITSIIEVAAIRNFLLSGFDPWRFFTIDIIFALAVIFTAAIPLCSIYRHQLDKNRKINNKSGD